MALCRRCESKIAPGKSRCSDCGLWQWDDGAVTEEGDGSILLEDIISSNVDRMQTGPWDKCFGFAENEDGTDGPAGIVRGSANLIGGSPGAGKSTLFLQIAAGCVANYGLPVLYLSAEEQLPQIKARAERMHVRSKRMIRFIDLRKGSANLGAVLAKYQFGLLILDSVKAVAESEEGAIEVCKVVKEFATIQHAPALLSQHVNKGNEIAGLMGLQHEVDGTYTFFPDETRIDPDNGEAIRVLETLKNRNGRAFISADFEMTKFGLRFMEDVDEDDDEEDD